MKENKELINKTLDFITNKKYKNSDAFLKAISKFLVTEFDADFSLIKKLSYNSPGVIESVVVNNKKGLLPNISYKLDGTPCENVVGNKICVYPTNIQALFPNDLLLVEMKVDSYIGVPLIGSTGELIGLIAILCGKQLKDAINKQAALQILAIKTSQLLEKRNDELILKERDEKFDSLSNLTFEGILIHDNGIAVEFNLLFLKMFGYNKKDLIGKNIINILFPKKYHAIISKSIKKKYTVPFEMVGIKKNGLTFPIEVEARNIGSKINDTLRVVAIRDITNRKLADHKLEGAINELKKSKIKYQNLYEEVEVTNQFLQESQKIALLGYYTYDFKEQRWNSSEYIRNLMGLETGQGTMKDWLTIIHPDDQHILINALNKRKEEINAPLDVTYRLVNPLNEKLHWIHHKARQLKQDAKGNLLPIIGVIQDITKIKEIQLKFQKNQEETVILNEDLTFLSNELKAKNNLLIESTDRFKTLFKLSPVSIWEQDFSEAFKLLREKREETEDIEAYLNENPDFLIECIKKIEIINVNKATLDLLGVDSLEELVSHIRKTNTKKSIESIKYELLTLAFFENEFTGETEFTGKGSGHISVIIKSTKINKKGRVIASVIDISNLKKVQLQLQMSKEKAEESDHLKTEFLNNMSHEIRTPMNGILGFTDLLKNPRLTEEKRNYFISIIQNSGNQLLHVIDDILEISRLGTKQVSVLNEEVCLNDLLLELFSIFDLKAKENETPLYLKKGLSDRESTVFIDKHKLVKIISNLLENSIKFTNKGYVEIGYYLNKNRNPIEIEIYVKDTGIGIKKEKQKIIFERFSQAEKELSKKAGGLGLGLSIAKENTELLGGKISLESGIMEGATFFITLPYKPIHKVEVIKEVQKKYTIVIAEDEEVNYLYLETLLIDVINLSCNIIHVKNGREVVDFCKKNPAIDLVLMDLKMPILNGYIATKQIRKFNTKIPIIAQTAYSTEDETGKAITSGCTDFISKPISKEVLKNVLKKYLFKKEIKK